MRTVRHAQAILVLLTTLACRTTSTPESVGAPGGASGTGGAAGSASQTTGGMSGGAGTGAAQNGGAATSLGGAPGTGGAPGAAGTSAGTRGSGAQAGSAGRAANGEASGTNGGAGTASGGSDDAGGADPTGAGGAGCDDGLTVANASCLPAEEPSTQTVYFDVTNVRSSEIYLVTSGNDCTAYGFHSTSTNQDLVLKPFDPVDCPCGVACDSDTRSLIQELGPGETLTLSWDARVIEWRSLKVTDDCDPPKPSASSSPFRAERAPDNTA